MKEINGIDAVIEAEIIRVENPVIEFPRSSSCSGFLLSFARIPGITEKLIKNKILKVSGEYSPDKS